MRPARARSGCAGGSRPGAKPTARGKQTGIEKLAGGQWQLVITEIPYMLQKGKLIEQIAQLIADKKLPILEDIRDESDEADPPRLRAQEPQRRSRTAQGIAVQADRSRKPLQPQPQRARCQPHARRDEPQAAAAGMDRSRRSTSCCAAASTGWTRSRRGSNCSTAISSPSSTLTGSSRSSAPRTSPSR